MNLQGCVIFILYMTDMTLCVREIKVGIILISHSGSPYDYERTMGALDLAVDYINTQIFDNRTTAPSSSHFRWQLPPPQAC